MEGGVEFLHGDLSKGNMYLRSEENPGKLQTLRPTGAIRVEPSTCLLPALRAKPLTHCWGLILCNDETILIFYKHSWYIRAVFFLFICIYVFIILFLQCNQ